jgi:hypothetical protein
MYADRTAVLATQHAKEKIFRRPIWHGLGMQLITPISIDTDQLGTFSGEVARKGTMKEVVLAKAKLGMELTQQTLAFANEGSFSPHPQVPFISCDLELGIFVDAEQKIEVYEQIMTTKTNHAQFEIIDKLNEAELAFFLKKIGFPEHAVIVKSKTNSDTVIYKGLQDYQKLLDAIAACTAQTVDGNIQIDTDMRAHLNPTRQKALRKLAFKLVRRLRSTCPSCAVVGWGMVDIVRGLPCSECEMPTQLVKQEIFGCVQCAHRLIQDIPNKQHADPKFCDYCNP